jgi:hypothetical protein
MNKCVTLILFLTFVSNIEAFLAPITHQHSGVGERLTNKEVTTGWPCSRSTSTSTFYRPAQQQSLMLLELKKNKKEIEQDIENKNENPKWLQTIKDKPQTLIIGPIFTLFFLDIVLNILVVAKRTIEVIFTGSYTEWHF